MLISFKFNYIFYQIEKILFGLIKFILYVRTNLIIYVMLLIFLIIQYIFIISSYVKKYIIRKIIFKYNIHSVQGADINLINMQIFDDHLFFFFR